MHPDFARADELSKIVIGAAVEVHRHMGPGLLESIYEKCLIRELELRSIGVRSQDMVAVTYKDFTFTEDLRFDLLVEGCLLVEVKCVQELHNICKAQLLSWLFREFRGTLQPVADDRVECRHGNAPRPLCPVARH